MTIGTDNPAPAPAAAANPALTFGQRIEAALATAWSDVETEGQMLLVDAEQFGEKELGVVENAIISTWNTYEPKAVALIQTYAQNAVAQLGTGATIEQVAESVIAQDSVSAAPFLEGALSAGLKAIVAALLATI